ncbi:MAG TPA: Wzz/FepE/Etk N-terminal domain-containing protein [Mycobacterium sp.]|jgi:capsular polysaccharide biosynthesis protein
MKLHAFLTAVRLYRKTFLVVTATVLALGLAWLVLTPLQYVSTTQLLVSIQGSTTAAAYQNDQVVTGRVNSYIALLTSDVVMKRVIDKLGLPLTTGELAAKVSATNVPPQTSVIDVAVTDGSPERAQRLANTLAAEFISYTDALETPTGDDAQKVHTTVVTAASEPHARIAERVVLGVLVVLAALLFGAIAVWIRAVTDPVIRTAYRAASAAGAAVVGYVTSAADASVGDLEGYRRLRTRLRSMINTEAAIGRGNVLVFASAAGEGDTAMIASNLGLAMELADFRSIVVDASFPVENRSTENEADGNGGPEDDSTQPSMSRGADGFPDTLAMPAWAHDSDLVAAQASREHLDRLRDEYAYTIVAAPPVLSTGTASVVSEYADAVLLVSSLGRTTKRELHRAADNLRATGAAPTGVVLDDTTSRDVAPTSSGANLLMLRRRLSDLLRTPLGWVRQGRAAFRARR